MTGLSVRKKGLSKAAKIGLWISGIILLIIIIFVGLWLWGSNDLNKKAQEAGNLYPEEVRNTYISSCSKESGGGHEDFCICTIEYFEENYSYEQFKDFEDESPLPGMSHTQTSLDATKACSDKLTK